MIVGRIGSFGFDNNVFNQIEERFRANLQKRKNHVVDGAKKAQ